MEGASRLAAGSLRYLMDIFNIELRNLEALGLAQQKMIEGAGALMKHQTEMTGETLRRALDAKAMATTLPSGIGAALASQITAVKTTILESQANSNILSELAARSSGEVANILQTRMLAALDELKAALEPVVGEATKPATAPLALAVQPATIA
jgi:hypothetical protein